jgi:Skp family chaperone for outer membrane proteins
MNRTTIATVSAALALALAGFLAGSADALRPALLRAAPTSVGVVDMATVFDRVDESADWDLRIRALEARSQDEMRARRGELETMAKEIEAMAAGPAKDAKIDEFRLRNLQLEQWAGLRQLEVDRERSLKWQAVYKSVREAAKRLGETEGYDLVLVDDSAIEIRTQRGQNAPSLESQAQSQIAQLRVLYSARTVDVTEKIIVQINNTRSVGGAKPASGG